MVAVADGQEGALWELLARARATQRDITTKQGAGENGACAATASRVPPARTAFSCEVRSDGVPAEGHENVDDTTMWVGGSEAGDADEGGVAKTMV